MSAPETFYWFDYETFGRSPRWDRPAQFAGRRTDLELNPIGEPAVFYCRLPGDYLPEPGACRVTGILPDTVMRKGLCEADFIARAVAELGYPGTVSVGYNSVRFDDEFTRFTQFRNLADPYAHEWRDGCSRWDLIDLARLMRALRPDGMRWPLGDDGQPVNTLGALASANGIEHAHAHDALSDVEATIELAACLRRAQPRLFDWAFAQRGKQAAATLLNVRAREPVLLCSTRLPRERHHLAAVLPLCRCERNANAVIAIDLATPPEALDGLDAAAIRARLGRDAKDPPIGLLSIKTNACPALAPFKTLRDVDAERLDIDRPALLAHRDRWLARLAASDAEALLQRLREALQRDWPDDDPDVDGSLYAGGFLGDADRARLQRLKALDPDALARSVSTAPPVFEDDRLEAMLLHYRARNWPATLDTEERDTWLRHVRERLAREDAPWLGWQGFETAMSEAPWGADEAPLRESLLRYARELRAAVERG